MVMLAWLLADWCWRFGFIERLCWNGTLVSIPGKSGVERLKILTGF